MVDPAGRADPRTIITPDAFSVAPDLLGLGLAHPWRRAAAILVDLVLVAILANASAVFFAFAAGLFVFWLALRKGQSGRTATAARRAARFTLGCLGAVALTVAALAIWFTMIADPDDVIRTVERAGQDAPPAAMAAADLARLVRGGDSAEVAAAARRMAERLREEEVDPEEVRTMIADFRSGPAAVAPGALDELEAALDEQTAARGADTAAANLDPDTLELDALVGRYSAARAAGDSAALAVLGPVLGAELAADRLSAQEAELEEVRDDAEDLREDLAETQASLEEERNRGILATVYAMLDDVGLGLGWSGLYFTFFLGWWHGRTPGKRLLGIRVVRLDGRPLGYWVAFERYGGYAASLFTGLEGFGRLIWDPNRQALEDKLAGTVVIRDTPEARERVTRLHQRGRSGAKGNDRRARAAARADAAPDAERRPG